MSEQDGAGGLRERKFRRWFEGVDADGDGYLTRRDMTIVSERYLAARNLAPESPDAQRLTAALDGLWTGLIAAADGDSDGHVTFAEMSALLVAELTAEEYAEQLGVIGELFFDLADANGDDKIDLTEFTHIFGTSGRAPDHECAEVFNQLDLDATGALSRQEYHQALREFLYGDDPAAPANHLFGRLTTGHAPPD